MLVALLMEDIIISTSSLYLAAEADEVIQGMGSEKVTSYVNF
jgi:hypothetical protein